MTARTKKAGRSPEPSLREQYEAGYLDIPAMGRHSLEEIGSWPEPVRRIAADGLRSVYDSPSVRPGCLIVLNEEDRGHDYPAPR